ncbi:MAG: DivIVA domain-containing protein [Clostridia bacterium]|nr:DivIVA domain-containing protein [Clostridia bacterium]
MINRLRSRLFGFKKSDVYDYIIELDERASEQLNEKDREIAELKAKLAEYEEKLNEYEKNRDAVVKALILAEKKAEEIVCAAEEEAANMRKNAELEIQEQRDITNREIQEQKDNVDREIREQKNNVNREIEIKRKAIKNYYSTENKKIDQIKSEVERMRMASMEAIQNFERQLREVERMTENSSSFLESAKNYADTGSAPEVFADIERNIPVHIIESISE